MTTTSSAILWADTDQVVQIDVTTTDGGATPQTMTGWTLEFVVRRASDEALVVSKTTASGISIGNGSGTNDRATVTIADTDIATLPGRNYHGGLWRTDSGSANPLWEGPVQIKRAARHS